MTRWTIISLSINLLLLAIGLFALHRLGGWRFVVSRVQHSETPLYQHRRQLFEQLPEQAGAIIFLGDSQTALCEWRELFDDSLPILNRGIVADHVAGVSLRLEEILRHQPAKIFLLVGVNDLLFGKSVAEIALGYGELVKKLRSRSPSTQLVLESVLPINNRVKNVGLQNAQIQALNTQIAQIARAHDLPFVDIYGPLTDSAGNLAARFTEDGVHLNGAGYGVWKAQLTPFFSQ
ncbi:MAG: GDSL-type esterase/lipase family protein [Saprospiraceae bacterium]